MNSFLERHLYNLQYRWQKRFGKAQTGFLSYEVDPQKCADIIYDYLYNGEPCMIGRFGNTEFNCIMNYLGVRDGWKIWKFLNGAQMPFWWLERTGQMMMELSGFFPNTHDFLAKFSKMHLKDIEQLDVLGCWIRDEYKLKNKLNFVNRVFLPYLEPYWAKRPWTRALSGKNVLVVHPFASLIEKQYNNHRTDLFLNSDILPEFNLVTIPAIQSLGGENNGFSSWFEALEYMKKQIDRYDYDICIIGCGAYGFPLAAHVKRQGKKAIHLGGATQLMFGIKGNRWEDDLYGVKEWGIPRGFYTSLFNEFWVKPDDSLKPKCFEKVEGACYW